MIVFLRLNQRMGRRYRTAPYGGPALLVRTRGWARFDDLDMAQYLTGERTFAEISGDHFTAVREPHVGALAAILRDALAAADRSPSSE
jgi:thioesterase domain-containing protein